MSSEYDVRNFSAIFERISFDAQLAGKDDQSKGSANDIVIPDFVKVTPHLRDDLTALTTFLEIDTPPIINDRCAMVQVVRYGFGDASGTGFGSTIESNKGLKYRVGVCGAATRNQSLPIIRNWRMWSQP